MKIIDSQLHDLGPRLPWAGADKTTQHNVMTEIMMAWMDAVGVDATLVQPRDDEWGTSIVANHPTRFAAVFSVRNPEAQDVAECVAGLRKTPGAVALRLSFGRMPADPTGEAGAAKFTSGVFEPLFRACERERFPLFCSAYGHPHFIGNIAEAHPTVPLIVDHMGIAQPPLNPRETPPWKSLGGLLALAKFPSVHVKLCGAPVLSDEPYPFNDVWPHLAQILEAFGAERVMWASDIGRFAGRISWNNEYAVAQNNYPGKHTYAESLFYLLQSDRLSRRDRELLLGGTVQRVIGWPS